MSRTNIFTGSVIVLFAVATIGCGQGFKTGTAASSEMGKTNTPVDITQELNKVEQASQEAETAMNEANAAIAQISDSNGNIKVGLFKSQSTGDVQAQGLLSGVTDKLKGVFDKVFERVAKVKDSFNKARGLLATAMAKLDENNPAHAAAIQQIMTQMARIDALEAKFSNSMHMLAGKLDLVSSGLEKLITGATKFIPGFGSIIGMALDYFVMGDIKEMIADLKARLMAL